MGIQKVLLFCSPAVIICLATCVRVDITMDTALLVITCVFDSKLSRDDTPRQYPCSALFGRDEVAKKMPLTCVGQPGRDDLESAGSTVCVCVCS